ncbi:hypothetical protein QQS21_001431 [Conoideocrella luteorostrata]|uniref:glucan endo-1,3-beta-D-glucosidase n=1 Tax=Conoideocrella luteorostrata TaxID=1105319 RepID=A0AAJ0FY80_9HYPO|nr:hypothetical protein QQS21_001431 [Conoideocrella luteorostrata]
MMLLRGLVLLPSLAYAAVLPAYTSEAADELTDFVSHRYGKRGTFGPISTDSATNLAGGTVACSALPVGSFFDGLKPPFPTNTWWASYAAIPGNGTAAGPFPYQSSLDGYGILFGMSANRQFDGSSIKQPTQVDWRASFAEHSGAFENHKAVAFDTQTITVQYFQGAGTLTALLVPGSPYMTFEFKSSTPLFKSMNGGIKSFGDKSINVGDTVSSTGTTFTVTDTKGATYIIYAMKPITLTATATSSDSGVIQAGGAYDGVIRLVKLADPSHKALLDQHYQIYPTAAALDYTFTDKTGNMIFTWDTVGDGANLLMLTWPHHRLKMENPNFPPTSSLGYLTTKGWMYPAIGNRWSLSYDLSPISWNPPRALDSSCQSSVMQGLEYEISLLIPENASVPNDFYYWGGTLAAKSRLALIAEHLGRQDLANKVVDYLKVSFNYWFHPSSSAVPAYETAWGGVINKAGADNVYVDFGNGYYNDHHFHYGYFLNIAAVIAKYDGNWLAQHREYINYFARDIINPSSQDPQFPVTRCRDWFAGHSWASGIANGAGSRDQESSGEAINGYYGALLWASVALSQDYVNYAKLLLASEQHAAQVYWHLYPQQSPNDRDNPYPESQVRDLTSMGNVMDYQSGAWLFWGSLRSQIAAIQILPLTPANEVLYDSQWVENIWSYTMKELQDPSTGDDWKCVIIAAYANYNPQVAAQWSGTLTTWELQRTYQKAAGSGNTYTNELFFIGTRPNPNGNPICSALPQNPYGTYKLQDVSSGKYVGVSATDSRLTASVTSLDSASVFKSAYLPNAGTLQLTTTNQYVTADQGGRSALAAIRDKASSWETFVIRAKEGAPSGVYSIKAGSNGHYVQIGSDGYLINNGAAESASSGFRFLAV